MAERAVDAWIKAIDEAMVVHHLGVAEESDDYDTAKFKLNQLLCAAQDIGALHAGENEADQKKRCSDPFCPCQDGSICHYVDGSDGTKAMAPFEPAQEEYVYDPTTRFVHRSRDGKRLFRICFDRMDDDGWTGECEEVLNRMSSNLSSFNTKSVDHLARICYEWANDTFPRRQMSSVLCKLFGEIGEFIDKPSPDEAADIFILISDLFKMNGIGIESAVEEKLKTLKAAAGWNESTIPGVYKRIK